MGKLFSKGTKYYRQSLLLIVAIATLPGLLLSGLMYWGAGGQIEQELHQLHRQNMEERAQTIDETLAHLELSLGHWAFEPQFNYTLGSTDFGQDYGRAWDITKTLLIIQSSSELIEHVELYVKGSPNRGSIRFSPEYSELNESALNEQYGRLPQHDRPIFWNNTYPGVQKQEQLTIIQKVPGNSKDPVGLLLVRLNMDKLAQLMGTLTPYNGAKTLIFPDNGAPIIRVGDGEENDAFIQELIRDIRSREQEPGLYYFDWQGSQYSVSYDHFTKVSTRWAYISAAPIQEITAPLLSISKLIIIVSCAALVIAVSMAWLASRRIYSPVGQLVHTLSGYRTELLGKGVDEFSWINQKWQELNRESTSLQTKLKHELPHLKESFVQQLIQGYLDRYSSSELIERFRQYGGRVDRSVFTVVHMELIGFSGLAGRFNTGDEGLVTFTACNIIEELAGSRLEQTYVINFHDLTMALLVVEPAATPRDRILSLCREFISGINELLRMQATVVVAPPTEDIKQIGSRFEGAKSTARYRSFEYESQIIDMEQPGLLAETGGLNYPFSIERELIQALRAGEREEAVQQLTLFMEALSAERVTEMDVQQGMMRLLAGILNVVSQVGMNPASLSKGENMFEALSQIRDTRSIMKWFNEHIIEPYMQELEKRTNGQVKRMIEQAKNYLQNEYAKDISLDSCAEHVGAAPYLLSKAFKAETGINFTEYLTHIRMDKAKALLRESDTMINEIALRVGYQPSYFIRLFKKLEGITPGRFRELVRDGGD
ncbi:AraC family transcriptional regulator [Paenibacillus mucilaginosus 3016]|uniref:AraC family transcriptional regulator n=1 Tax=Paenibacillus mucilaginosus 3016 TaxID=1116391 RepID=H6NMW2_9BACL|nr:AraC family transcriptional regulator [Paenibacillus mucilaginosus]AFC31002.1 AraC family transcriptional regulator [Paenibacillus mucilaginosus 3016]WFA22667.1 AraC family transcriptional regulator [Paenibacillus mucilaginosus]